MADMGNAYWYRLSVSAVFQQKSCKTFQISKINRVKSHNIQDPISVLFLKKYFYCIFVRNITTYFILVLVAMKNILSVSADLKIEFIGLYRYQPI